MAEAIKKHRVPVYCPGPDDADMLYGWMILPSRPWPGKSMCWTDDDLGVRVELFVKQNDKAGPVARAGFLDEAARDGDHSMPLSI